MSEELGFLYFAKTADGRYVKIGYSMHPGSRITGIRCDELRRFSTHSVRFAAVVAAPWQEETATHALFSDLAIGNEWFRSSPRIDAYIESLTPRFIPHELWHSRRRKASLHAAVRAAA